MAIAACARCASTDLHLPTIRDGGVLGYSVVAEAACHACGNQGAPVVFDDAAAFRAYRDGIDHPRQAGPTRDMPEPRAAIDGETAKEDATSLVMALLMGLLAIAFLVAGPVLLGMALADDGVARAPGAEAVMLVLAVGTSVLAVVLARASWRTWHRAA